MFSDKSVYQHFAITNKFINEIKYLIKLSIHEKCADKYYIIRKPKKLIFELYILYFIFTKFKVFKHGAQNLEPKMNKIIFLIIIDCDYNIFKDDIMYIIHLVN